MKFETFQAGVWRQRYQYKSFEPVPVNHAWTWEDPTINALLEQANRALGELNAFSLIVPDIDLFIEASYYDALMRVRVAHDMIHWVRFFLKGVAETAAKGRDVFRQILVLRTEVESAVLGLGKRAPNAQQALNLLYRQPLVSASEVERALGVSAPTANALIRDLVRLGVLTEITGQQRWRTYTFDRYLRLFVS